MKYKKKEKAGGKGDECKKEKAGKKEEERKCNR
jgi:hypothetical protein